MAGSRDDGFGGWVLFVLLLLVFGGGWLFQAYDWVVERRDRGEEQVVDAAADVVEDIRAGDSPVDLPDVDLPDVDVSIEDGDLTVTVGDTTTTVAAASEPPVTVAADTTIADDPTTTVPADSVPQAGVPCDNIWLPAPTGDQIAAAQTLLATIPVERENGAGYDRDLFGNGWLDIDNDGFDGRQQTLGQQSVIDAEVDVRYRIVSGLWCDAYSTTDGPGVYVADYSTLDIDHVVALKEAWDSGAHSWDAETRRQFANDTTHTLGAGGLQLIAVDGGENRAKSDKDPPQWMPRNPTIRCAYLVNWVEVKATWGLSMDESEFGYIRNRLAECAAGETPKRPGG